MPKYAPKARPYSNRHSINGPLVHSLPESFTLIITFSHSPAQLVDNNPWSWPSPPAVRAFVCIAPRLQLSPFYSAFRARRFFYRALLMSRFRAFRQICCSEPGSKIGNNKRITKHLSKLILLTVDTHTISRSFSMAVASVY